MSFRRVVLSLLLPITLMTASEWPNWRGPTLDGASTETELPAVLDASTQAWELALPGPSAGTPVVKNERIYLPSIDKATANLMALCVDQKTGKMLWSHPVGPSLGANSRNDWCTPSAATDGEHVVFLYGNGDVVGFTTDGKKLWDRNLQKEYGKWHIEWMYGSSPLMHGGKVYLQVLQNEQKGAKFDGAASYLLCIDPKTGENIWRHARPTAAPLESGESYGTPIIYTTPEGREELTLFGGDLVTAHDPATGKELWRCDGFNDLKKKNWRSIPGSTLIDGNVVSIAGRGSIVFAVKPGGSGDVTASNVVWKTSDLSSDVCMPLFYQDKLYLLNGDKKVLRCADPQTGKVLWEGEIPSGKVLRASPSGGSGKLYTMNEAGTVYVLSADKFEILGTYELGSGDPGFSRSSIVLANGQVLVRTTNRLIAFGKK